VLKKKIIRAIDDFFQYKKSGDDEILDEVLDKIEYKDKYVIIDGEEKIKVDKKKGCSRSIFSKYSLYNSGPWRNT
jgi:hypothetical protein